MRSLRAVAARRPVAAFFVLAFAWSWGLFAFLYLALGAEALAGSRVFHVPFA